MIWSKAKEDGRWGVNYKPKEKEDWNTSLKKQDKKGYMQDT